MWPKSLARHVDIFSFRDKNLLVLFCLVLTTHRGSSTLSRNCLPSMMDALTESAFCALCALCTLCTLCEKVTAPNHRWNKVSWGLDCFLNQKRKRKMGMSKQHVHDGNFGNYREKTTEERILEPRTGYDLLEKSCGGNFDEDAIISIELLFSVKSVGSGYLG